ncbi:MAG TPA: hypothetical protein VK652_01080 [Steroidobacteraceae bacterium]|nr:hypothetical protein [Steroidobacteraceae bacterium]
MPTEFEVIIDRKPVTMRTERDLPPEMVARWQEIYLNNDGRKHGYDTPGNLAYSQGNAALKAAFKAARQARGDTSPCPHLN